MLLILVLMSWRSVELFACYQHSDWRQMKVYFEGYTVHNISCAMERFINPKVLDKLE